jgi:hypothetical protein
MRRAGRISPTISSNISIGDATATTVIVTGTPIKSRPLPRATGWAFAAC